MTKRVFAVFAALVWCGLFTGCTSTDNSIQAYSIRSYQGPIPMSDLQYVNPEAYGVPLEPR